MANAAVRLLVSATFAGALVLLVFAALPQELDVRTDIVGYPTHSNFNIDRYFWAYGLGVGAFPLATLALYAALTRAFVGRAGARGPIPPPYERVEPVPVATGRRAWVVAAARTLFVGAVLGLEAAVFASAGRGREIAFVAVAIGYAAAVGLAGWLVSRTARRPLLDAIALANMLGVPLTVAALYLVSEATQVTVLATGAVHEYPWLPAWLAFGVTAALYVWLGIRLRKVGTHAERNALERRALLLVAAPVLLFLTVAEFPADLGTVNLFEDGQILAASELTREGAFPWRDLLFVHGFLSDVFRGLFSFAVFENSAWGLVAGSDLLFYPAVWVAQYYLCTFLFGTNWLFLLGSQLVIVTGHVFAINGRFLLVPFVVILLVAMLQRASVARAVAFTSLLFVQVIVTPEALVAAVACLGTLVLYELYYYERGTGVVRGFRRTWLVAATIATLALAWSMFLLANRALDDWVFSFAVFIPGHRYTGGIPSFFPATEVEVLAPILLILAVFAFFVAMTRLRRPFAFQDWALLAMAGLTLLYFSKFLSRADAHLYQSFSAAVPPLFYAAYRAITFGEAFLVRAARARRVSWVPVRHSLTVPLLLVLLVTAPVWPQDVIRDVPGRFGVVVTQEPQVDRIGYARQSENDTEMMAGVSQELDSLLGSGGTVFDFSNAPGLFHYLLDLPPSTRYYHISLAIRQQIQIDLIRLLEEDRPELVVFTSDGDGLSLPAWDEIANQVRHYDVSEYLLDNYVPVLDSHGFVLMIRRDAGDAVPQLYFHVDPCDWGFVPNFFTPEPAPSAESVSLPHRVREAGQRLEVTLPADAAAYGWLELRTGRPLAEGRFELSDRPGGDARRSIAFETLDRGETSVRVKVGACSQWRGYRPGTLSLTSSVPQDVAEIRLVR